MKALRYLKYKILPLAAALLSAAAVPSCADREFDLPDYTLSGQEVTLSIPLKLPQMEARSRAALDDNAIDLVENLWIRTYSESTGRPTSDWKKLDPASQDTENGRPVEINIRTQSGYNYIVAVANVNNRAIDKNDPATVKTLAELLEAADSWEEFLDIAVLSPSDFSTVNAPSAPLPMAGSYTDIDPGGEHPSNLSEWQTRNFVPHFIPAQKEIVKWPNGAIHLRRLVSHLNFRVIPGNEEIDVTVNSYTVFNAPKYTWLYERPKRDGMNANFGDAAASEEQAGDYYADVPRYASQYIRKDPDDGRSTFDFWLGENKHEGTSTTYQERDRLSNGLFTSLTGDAWTPNNMAAYVRMSCTIDYAKQLSVDAEGETVEAGGTQVHRTASAEYCIHLGYIEGSGTAEKSRDFNCYRNTDCTYNITVNGVNDIRVDAWAKEGERYSGEEGVVSDLMHASIELDAHYHAFNIRLTEEELSAANFGFTITSYYNGVQHNFDETGEYKTTDANAHLYNWIELRPADDGKTLAGYKPRFGSNSDGKTFLLTDLKNGWTGMTEKMRSSSGWYTVFVNEYTYENIYTGTEGYADETGKENGLPKWMTYVNQNPRRFYIKVTRSVSPDGRSIYVRSKYGILQKSIQTYYSDRIFSGNATAIGSERTNETEGLNMRSPGTYGTDGANGRYNAAEWLTRKGGSLTGSNRPNWSDFVDAARPMEIPAVTGLRAQNGPDLPDRTGDNAEKLPKLANSSAETLKATFSDPQGSDDADYFIDVYNACMNRNRDNNGNGVIDPEELRWYIPAMGKYLRLLLGAPSLSEPLLDFEKIDGLPLLDASRSDWQAGSGEVVNDYMSRYMYATSDGARVLWAMEGMSTSTWAQVHDTWSKGNTNPWQIRCIRNLGTDLNTITKGDKVDMAYEVDKTNRIVAFSYYDDRAVRPYKLSGNGAVGTDGAMPPHSIISEFNVPYRKFEYAASDLTVESASKTLTGLQGYIESNPCGSQGDGWRVPTQKELAILLNSELLTGAGSYLSCTYNYFNGVTGAGGTYTNGSNYFLGVLGTRATNGSRGTQFTIGNISGYTMYVRCVRDTD